MRGLPPFSEIRAEDVEPAIDALLEHNRGQLGDLAQLNGAPSVARVIVPVEQLRHRLARTWSPVSHLNAVMNSDPMRAAYNACLPKLSAYHTEVGQNEALYRAYASIAADPALTPAQRALVDDALRDFRLAGVALPADRKARFKMLMQELARLQARFEENVLDAANAWSLLIGDPSRLRGLPEHVAKRAQSEAAQRGEKGWLLTLDFPTFHAVVTHADDVKLRRELYEAWSTRASDRGPQARRFDNTEVMREILQLRHEVARMLGFPSFAEYSCPRAAAKWPSSRAAPAVRSRRGTSRTTPRSCGVRATTSPTSSCGLISPSSACSRGLSPSLVTSTGCASSGVRVSTYGTSTSGSTTCVMPATSCAAASTSISTRGRRSAAARGWTSASDVRA
jgi:oligopeptidase A